MLVNPDSVESLVKFDRAAEDCLALLPAGLMPLSLWVNYLEEKISDLELTLMKALVVKYHT